MSNTMKSSGSCGWCGNNALNLGVWLNPAPNGDAPAWCCDDCLPHATMRGGKNSYEIALETYPDDEPSVAIAKRRIDEYIRDGLTPPVAYVVRARAERFQPVRQTEITE